FGQVTSAKVMMERETGRSKGFGFVEMGSDAEAQAAITGMNGQSMGGRSVVVNEARPMEQRPRGFGGSGGGGGGGYGGGGCGGGVRPLALTATYTCRGPVFVGWGERAQRRTPPKRVSAPTADACAACRRAADRTPHSATAASPSPPRPSATGSRDSSHPAR